MPTIVLLTFLPVFAIVLIALLLVNRYLSARQKSTMSGALREAPAPVAKALTPILMDPAKIALSGLLAQFRVKRKLDRYIQQAGVSWTSNSVFTLMAVCAAAGALVGTRLRLLIDPALSSTALAIVMALAPLVPLRMKRKKRLKEFEKQLPDALDFLARAMRAGHAFSISLKIMADESPDPLGQEFRKLCAEHGLGGSMGTALEALLARNPLLDLQFFAAAVTLQRQTGGNLSEVLLRLSHVIRDRFALRGKVSATSAHGRMTGMVLAGLPLAMAGFLMVTSPDYLMLLARDPLGKYLILGALAGQLMGFVCIQKICDFEI